MALSFSAQGKTFGPAKSPYVILVKKHVMNKIWHSCRRQFCVFAAPNCSESLKVFKICCLLSQLMSDAFKGPQIKTLNLQAEELWEEGGEGGRCLKNVGTQHVKYHPWTKTIAATVVFEDLGCTCALFMLTNHLRNRAAHSCQQFVKRILLFFLSFYFDVEERVHVCFPLHWLV